MVARHAGLVSLLLLCGAVLGQEPAPVQAGVRERAHTAEQRGEYDVAAELFLQLAAAEPQRAEWQVAAGRCLGRAGRFNQALDLLDAQRKRFPGVLDLPAMLARTMLLKAEGDAGALHPEVLLADAAAICREVLAVDPDHQDALLVLAQSLHRSGDPAARTAAEDAVRRLPRHAGAWILLGRVEADAFARARAELPMAGDDEETQRAVVARMAGAREAALRCYRTAAELDPKRTFPHVAMGDLLRESDGKAALGHYAAALRIDPGCAAGQQWIEQYPPGVRLEFYAPLLAEGRSRPDADPVRLAALEWMVARAHYDAGDLATAGKAFVAVVAANPAYVNAHYYAAVCAWRTNDPDGAEHHAAAYARAGAATFADVVRALPPELRAELGQLVQYLGDRAYREGRIENSRDLNHVVACLRDSADAWNNHAFLCRETGRHEESLVSYQHALEKEPLSPQLHNDTAVVLHHHLATPENLRRARILYERAVELARAVVADPRATEPAREQARKTLADAGKNLADLGDRGR
ncbi:MAG: hypothetical protein RL148_3100 [Planctomycetota bacterium]